MKGRREGVMMEGVRADKYVKKVREDIEANGITCPNCRRRVYAGGWFQVSWFMNKANMTVVKGSPHIAHFDDDEESCWQKLIAKFPLTIFDHQFVTAFPPEPDGSGDSLGTRVAKGLKFEDPRDQGQLDELEIELIGYRRLLSIAPPAPEKRH